MIAAASPNFTTLAIFAALWSVGVSGFIYHMILGLYSSRL
jgi:hypothetical protein